MNKKHLVLMFATVFLLMFSMQMVVAADPPAGLSAGGLAMWWLNEYLVPEGEIDLGGESYGLNNGLWILIGIFGAVVLFMIIADILLLVSPLSDYISWTIAVGVLLILIFTGIYRNFVAWVFIGVAGIFGGGAVIALIMTAVMFFIAVIVLFFGGNWFRKWLLKIRSRKNNLLAAKQAHKEGAKIIKGKTILEDAAE